MWKRLYQSDNILTTVSVINENLYIGEINLETKQNYLTINEKVTSIGTPVSLIYQMEGNPYFATFKGALSERENCYEIQNYVFIPQLQDKIYFRPVDL